MKGPKEQRVVPKIGASANNPDMGPGLLYVDFYAYQI